MFINKTKQNIKLFLVMPSFKNRSKLGLPWKGEQSYFDSFILLQSTTSLLLRAQGVQNFEIFLLCRSYEASNKVKY